MSTQTIELKSYIRDIPDFPKKGIIFKDITPLLADKDAFSRTIKQIAEVGEKYSITKIMAIESRGFIFGSAVAHAMNVGVIPVRKKGKLPHKTFSETYQLEYGQDSLEMHIDALTPGEKVLIVDDVLATGGTAQAVAQLVKKAGGEPMAMAFVIELNFLNGRDKIKECPVVSLIHY